MVGKYSKFLFGRLGRRKASLSLIMKEQVSRLAKSAVVQYVTVFRLILAKMTDCVRRVYM